MECDPRDFREGVPSFLCGRWQRGEDSHFPIYDAALATPLSSIRSAGLDVPAALRYAREVGGPALRALTFQQRARMLRRVAEHLQSCKAEFYELSYHTGATKADSWIDIDGGIATLFSYQSLARRELPDSYLWLEDEAIPLAQDGSFAARHLLVPKEGVAVHINAFNFPCWGMLEKLAPTLLAGMPAIIKPAPQSAYLAQAMLLEMLPYLPEGALQLLAASEADVFSQLEEQDVVTFTGSAATGRKLKAHPRLLEKAVPFHMEADSLNCSVLGADAQPETPEFALFCREVSREMLSKAGQKCTAIRRVLVPRALCEAVAEALQQRLAKIFAGDPRRPEVKLGSLVSTAQRQTLEQQVQRLQQDCDTLYQGDIHEGLKRFGGQADAFYPPTLLYCDTPLHSDSVHEVEAFGPVSTLMPYDSLDEAIAISQRGRGSLVSSMVSYDRDALRYWVQHSAAYHGRLYILNRSNAKAATGHGSPLPQLSHGGPGRAGGSEELGGMRALRHYMQRTAVQADPTTLMAISGEYVSGAEVLRDPIHPFRKSFETLQIGECYSSRRRTVSEADIVNFAALSGDHFYAHTDAIAAADSLFGQRVAHGYFLVSAAAGLFVDPAPGPVLANYGLEALRFIEPVGIGDSIRAHLTVKRKTKKIRRQADDPLTGVVVWDVRITNQEEALVASYSILTLVARDSLDPDDAVPDTETGELEKASLSSSEEPEHAQ